MTDVGRDPADPRLTPRWYVGHVLFAVMLPFIAVHAYDTLALWGVAAFLRGVDVPRRQWLGLVCGHVAPYVSLYLLRIELALHTREGSSLVPWATGGLIVAALPAVVVLARHG